MNKKELSEDTKQRLNSLVAIEHLYKLIKKTMLREQRALLAAKILGKLSLPFPYLHAAGSEEEYEYYSHTFTDIEEWLYEQLKEDK